MSKHYDWAVTTTARAVRTDIDAAKLDQIQRQAREARALVEHELRRARDLQEDIAHAIATFPASLAAAAHWRPSDDTSVFLQMSEEQAAPLAAEVRAARRIQQDKEALAALRARIDTLHTRHIALAQLARACETYAHGLEA